MCTKPLVLGSEPIIMYRVTDWLKALCDDEALTHYEVAMLPQKGHNLFTGVMPAKLL